MINKSDNLWYALKYAANPDGPLYGWKILRVNFDGTLSSLRYPLNWTPGQYFVATRFPHNLKPGDNPRGGPGIHAAGPDNFGELWLYMGKETALVIVKFAGKVYVGQTPEGTTAFLAEKAKPVAVITEYRELGEKISKKYNIPFATHSDLIQVEPQETEQKDLGNSYSMSYIQYKPTEKALEWINEVAPGIDPVDPQNLMGLIASDLDKNRMTINVYKKGNIIADIQIFNQVLSNEPIISDIYVNAYVKSRQAYQAIGKSLLNHAIDYVVETGNNDLFAVIVGLIKEDKPMTIGDLYEDIWKYFVDDNNYPWIIAFANRRTGINNEFYLNSDYSLALQVNRDHNGIVNETKFASSNPRDAQLISEFKKEDPYLIM